MTFTQPCPYCANAGLMRYFVTDATDEHAATVVTFLQDRCPHCNIERVTDDEGEQA